MGVVSNLKNSSDSRIPSVDCKFVGTGRFPALETMLNRFPVAELLGNPPSPAAQRAHSHGNACGPASRRSQNLLKPRCARQCRQRSYGGNLPAVRDGRGGPKSQHQSAAVLGFGHGGGLSHGNRSLGVICPCGRR